MKTKCHISHLPRNDNSCGWVNTLPSGKDIQIVKGVNRAKWTVVGAGFSGLSLARRLAELFPDDRILLVEAQRAGEGASGRNSGFIVDASPGRIGDDETMISMAKQNYHLNMAGTDILREQVLKHKISCDWDEGGKYHCAAQPSNALALDKFQKMIEELEIPNRRLDQTELVKRFGIDHYVDGLWTGHGVLVQPAALAKGLAATLPENVYIFEDSPVIDVNYGPTVKLTCPEGTIESDSIIWATNAYLPKCGQFQMRLMPMTMTASMTRPLTKQEQEEIGNVKPWGILSAHRMGATIRYTNDHRIVLRNTAEFFPRLSMTKQELAKRLPMHKKALQSRWPMLPDLMFEHTWSGVVCVSRNFTSVFGPVADNVYTIGCYNAGGIARGSLFGVLMAEYLAGQHCPLLEEILELDKPQWMPPRPFLDIGATLEIYRNKFGVGIDL